MQSSTSRAHIPKANDQYNVFIIVVHNQIIIRISPRFTMVDQISQSMEWHQRSVPTTVDDITRHSIIHRRMRIRIRRSMGLKLVTRQMATAHRAASKNTTRFTRFNAIQRIIRIHNSSQHFWRTVGRIPNTSSHRLPTSSASTLTPIKSSMPHNVTHSNIAFHSSTIPVRVSCPPHSRY
jgi:hypothetical protein